jgi:hypothetical protein
MPKPKIFGDYDLPYGVACIVKAVCADYERRKKAITLGKVNGFVLQQYSIFNTAIDKTLQSVDPGLRVDLMRDLANGSGYNFSQASPYMAKNTYYRYKKKFIYELAIELHLL